MPDINWNEIEDLIRAAQELEAIDQLIQYAQKGKLKTLRKILRDYKSVLREIERKENRGYIISEIAIEQKEEITKDLLVIVGKKGKIVPEDLIYQAPRKSSKRYRNLALLVFVLLLLFSVPLSFKSTRELLIETLPPEVKQRLRPQEFCTFPPDAGYKIAIFQFKAPWDAEDNAADAIFARAKDLKDEKEWVLTLWKANWTSTSSRDSAKTWGANCDSDLVFFGSQEHKKRGDKKMVTLRYHTYNKYAERIYINYTKIIKNGTFEVDLISELDENEFINQIDDIIKWAMGIIFMRNQAYESAIREFEAIATETSTQDRMVKIAVAECYMKLKNYSEAKNIYESILQSFPKDKLTNHNLGLLHIVIDGNLDLAIQRLRVAQGDTADDPMITANLQKVKQMKQELRGKEAYLKEGYWDPESGIFTIDPDKRAREKYKRRQAEMKCQQDFKLKNGNIFPITITTGYEPALKRLITISREAAALPCYENVRFILRKKLAQSPSFKGAALPVNWKGTDQYGRLLTRGDYVFFINAGNETILNGTLKVNRRP
ncbi:MAG: tetratricopeptide repeat protein [Bacteroidota bacterium]